MITLLVSVLVSALVSAVVALGVEWAAKPRLEARKERLLTIARARWRMWECLDDLLHHGSLLQTPLSSSLKDDIRAAHDAVEPATRDLEAAYHQTQALGGHRDRSEIVGLVASYVGNVRGLMASDYDWPGTGRMLVSWTEALMDVLGGPGQRLLYPLRRRYRSRRKAELLQALDTAGPAARPGASPPAE